MLCHLDVMLLPVRATGCVAKILWQAWEISFGVIFQGNPGDSKSIIGSWYCPCFSLRCWRWEPNAEEDITQAETGLGYFFIRSTFYISIRRSYSKKISNQETYKPAMPMNSKENHIGKSSDGCNSGSYILSLT